MMNRREELNVAMMEQVNGGSWYDSVLNYAGEKLDELKDKIDETVTDVVNTLAPNSNNTDKYESLKRKIA